MLCIRSPDGEWAELSVMVQKSTPDRNFRVHKLHFLFPDPELPFTSSASCHGHQGEAENLHGNETIVHWRASGRT